MRMHLPQLLHYWESPYEPTYAPALAAPADPNDSYIAARDAVVVPAENDNDATAPRDPQPSESHGSPRSDNGVTTSLQLSRKSRSPMLDHQDKYMMKAQVYMLKSSAISDVQPLPQRKHYCQIYQAVKHMLRGRLLASFQDHEHEGGDTRLQDGIKDNDVKI
nr:hypothetical protein [Tanacetum cinerariifolium]